MADLVAIEAGRRMPAWPEARHGRTSAARGRFAGGWALAVVVAVGAVALPFFANQYYVQVATIGLLYAYLSASWNVIGGYAGQMSLGHAIFFGIGSYAFGLFAVYGVGPLILSIPVALIVTFAVASAIAAVCFKYRLRGLHFAVGTLLLAEIVRLIAVNWDVLGRSQGLAVVARESVWNLQFASRTPYYFIILAAVVAIVLGTARLERSRLGFSMIALREQEDSARALGIDTDAVKRRSFVISAVLTSLGGSLHGALLGYVNPSLDLGLEISLVMVMGALLGGRGTVWGPIVGGMIVEVIQEALNFGGSLIGTTSVSILAQMMYGIFLAVVVLALPHGIVGTIARRRTERRASREAEDTASRTGRSDGG